LDKHKKKDDTSKDVSQNDAAKLLSVSVPSVQRAKQVVEKGSSELVQAVECGEINLNQAVNLIKSIEDKEEQTKIVSGGVDSVKKVNKAKAIPKCKPKAKPTNISATADEADDYDHPAIKAFEVADYQLNTIRRMIGMLSAEDRQTLVEEIKRGK
jgi:hypothetical protein